MPNEPEIAGSRRNSFRASVTMNAGGRALNEVGAKRLPNSIKLECRIVWQWTAGDSFVVERNSPDRQLRSEVAAKWERMWSYRDSQEVG